MKKKKWIYITLSLFILSVGGTLFYTALPGILEQYYLEKSFKEVNLVLKKVQIGKDQFEYGETGVGETILLIHGFQGDKRSWVPYIKELNKNYHIIALDLPGHGGSDSPKSLKYDLRSLAQFVEVFVRKKELNHFHLMGISMGGGIATMYATMYPEKLKSLILLNPYGARTEEKSEIEKEIENGKNLFFPKNLEEFDQFITYIRGKPLSLAKFFKEHILCKMKEKQNFYRKVFFQLVCSEKLDPLLHKILVPTLLLVGENDQIIHPSSHKSFHKHLPNVKIKLMKDAGHVFIGSFFDDAVDSMKTFLKEKDNFKNVVKEKVVHKDKILQP